MGPDSAFAWEIGVTSSAGLVWHPCPAGRIGMQLAKRAARSDRLATLGQTPTFHVTRIVVRRTCAFLCLLDPITLGKAALPRG
jgi:hypothetical protein